MEPKIRLRSLEEYIREGLGVLEVDNDRVEARITIHLDPYGETVNFTIKGRIMGEYVVLEKYLVEIGGNVYERPSDELEAWVEFIEERYGGGAHPS